MCSEAEYYHCDKNEYQLGEAKERIAELSEKLAASEVENGRGMKEAVTLATSMHRQFYANSAPDWKPLDTVQGVISQIDNMFAGLREENAALREAARWRKWPEDGIPEVSGFYVVTNMKENFINWTYSCSMDVTIAQFAARITENFNGSGVTHYQRIDQPKEEEGK